MKLNQQLFEHSCKHPEPLLDPFYMFMKKDEDLDSYYEKSARFRSSLIRFHKHQNENNAGEKISALMDEIQSNWGRFISYTHFGAFINACKTNRDEVGGDKRLLKYLIQKYIEERDFKADFSKSVIQGYIDKGSSRKHGGTGKRKMQRILEDFDFLQSNSWESFWRKKKVYSLCGTGNFSVENIRSELNIKVETAVNNQEKQLDFLIKNDDKFYLVEQKNMGVSGGGQDKSIKELIDLIKYKEEDTRVSYVAFLDGTYFHDVLLLGPKKNKKQIEHINKYLEETNNFWLNTSGFKELLKLN